MSKSSFDMSGLVNGLNSMENKADKALRAYAETSAVKLQNDARQNARWTDRTGDARKRLTGSQHPVANGYKLQLAHGVDYGLWLELAHEKRFSIIPETIEYTGTFEIMPGLAKLLNRLR